MAFSLQGPRHLPCPVERRLQELTVDPGHQVEVLRALAPRHMIECRTAERRQPALLGNRQVGLVGLDHRFAPLPGSRRSPCSKKSRSTVSSPYFVNCPLNTTDRHRTPSASSRACDLKGEDNTFSNKPRNETIAPRLPELAVHYSVDRVFGSDRRRRWCLTLTIGSAPCSRARARPSTCRAGGRVLAEDQKTAFSPLRHPLYRHYRNHHVSNVERA